MSTESDDRQSILRDFRAWIGQNESMGQDWFILEDGPEPDVIDAPASQPAPAEPADPFEAECGEFVVRTMALIAEQPAPTAAAGGTPDKAAALAALRSEVLPCEACSLHESRNSVVFGSGNADAEVVFIGEAPGRDEDLQGEPFVGASGKLLTKIMGAIGYDRDDVFICNILKCRPPNNRDPLPVEVQACEPHLKRQLAILEPKVICCLGRVAAQTLLRTEASLGKLRETVHFYEGIPVMATYHPAALLRNPGWKRDTWNDVRKMRALVDALRAEEG